MKATTLVALLTILAGASAFLIKVPTVPTLPKAEPRGWVHIQKLLLPLFENVCEESSNPIIISLAQEFSFESAGAEYLKPEVIDNLNNLKVGKGLLAKGEIFTEYNTDHLNELRALYEVFYYTQNFDTFYKAAAWARQNVNCGLFVDALYMAILHRRDTEHLSVPAPYELIPNYFVRKDVIINAATLLSGELITPSETVRDEGNAYILSANYTADYMDNDYESKLAYFHEDIGLNSFYFLRKLKWAPWFNTPLDLNIRYGEYMYHMMKQLAARYDLERYSNGFSELETSFAATPYDPMLIYSNGNEFSQRGTSDLTSADFQFLKTIENNLPTVVTHMIQTGYNKTQVLNHLMEILVTSDKSYETVARNLIGKDPSNLDGQPCVLEHYMTSLRDPIFWKLNKKIVDLVDEALNVIPSYTRNELYFPGVEVINVDVKKMATFFDYFSFDVTDALKTGADTNFQIKIDQQRLNHKPFALKLNISSIVSQKGFIKIYLGPKIAPGELALKKNLFTHLDSFEYNLKIGINVISRTSEEMKGISKDFTSIKTLRTNVVDAEFGLNILPLNSVESTVGFPSRFILPKGTPEGLPLQIFVFVAPFVKATMGGLPLTGLEFNTAILSPGYPLDLSIDYSQLFELPNAMVKDFIVSHKGDSKSSNYGSGGTANKWQPTTSYNGSPRSEYLSKKKEPFDYKSKKFGKKDDSSEKRSEYPKGSQDGSDINDSKFIQPIEINKDYKDTIDTNFVKAVDTDKDSSDLPINTIDVDQDIISETDESTLTSKNKRAPTVFDYILNGLDYDYDSDDKVYE